MSWTPEATDYVKVQWMAGKSATEIAVLLKSSFGLVKTRNAVIGRLHRAGLSSFGRDMPAKPSPQRVRAPTAPRVRKVEARRPPKPGPQNRPAIVHGKRLGVDFVSDPTEAEAQKALFRKDGLSVVDRVTSGAGIASPNARPFLEAGSGCKWPIGPQGAVMACCNPIARGVYCEGHAAVAYVPDGDRRTSKGTSFSAPSVIENHAVYFTRFDRVDHVARVSDRKIASPFRTEWDEGREAA